jgi:S-DNA-T family DNA segregation ATPase FtsK/SpoIIIE
VLPFRDLFPTRIGLRLTEEAHVDLTLGEGARDRGALCDRVPKGPQHAGTAYVVLDGDPAPMRVRFSYLTDTDIADLTRDYGRLRVVDGDWTEGGAA